MLWLLRWLFVYILGGLTFIPIVLALTIGYVLTYGSVPNGNADPLTREKASLRAKQEREEYLEREKGRAATAKPLSGWLTVRRQFSPGSGSTPLSITTTTGGENVRSDSPDVAHLAGGENGSGNASGTGEKDDLSIHSGTSGTPSNTSTAASIVAPTTYSARIAQTYRQVMESRQKHSAAPKEYLYAVLKGSVLFLYEDETQSDCVAAIGVNKYIVGMENSDGGRFPGRDGEMFAKRHAIVLRLNEGTAEKNGLPALSKGMSSDEGRDEEKEAEGAPWFFFSKSTTKTEDWYLALTQESALRPTTEHVFSESDMQALVDTIDTEPDPIPMRWLNAMLGRMFFGVYRTEALEQLIIGKIMKKLSKVPRPSFLGPIIIREVNVGTFPPIFSKPMLKDLTSEGTASFEAHINYRSRPQQPNSEVRITIATTATIPTGFKPYVVDLVLAVVLRSLEGNMVMQIKRPPSNRFWYGFTQVPKMEVEIQPIVSERKIQIGMVLKAIEKQLREVIAESVVLPNMDDIAFFDTSALDIRGGIFSSAGKIVDPPTVDLTTGNGTETPTQPGVEIAPSVDTVLNPTGDVGQIRKRNPTKSQTVDTHGPPVPPTKEAEPELGISRVDTAPALLGANGAGRGTSTAIQATKKWFATSNMPPSMTSVDTLKRASSLTRSSGESARSHNADQPAERPRSLAGTMPEASSSDTELVKSDKDSTDEKTKAAAARSVNVQTGFQDQRPIAADSGASTAADPGARTTDSPTDSVASSTTASLITSLRARDKQAIQSQVNTARDTVKKWGVNWAAKRRQFAERFEEGMDNGHAAVYRPPDEDVHNAVSSSPEMSKSSEGTKTLQERLNAAAATANRPKSGSVSSNASASQNTTSRPSLQPSPSKSSVATFDSQPQHQWTLSTAAPVTGIEKADIAARPGPSGSQHAQAHLGKMNEKSGVGAGAQGREQAHERRGSSSNPVLTQPVGGRSMVVPRVPKRPGQVVGIGSNDGGITRRISGGEEPEESLAVKPALPPRRSLEIDHDQAEQEELKDGGAISPPRLPPRKASPAPPATAVEEEAADRSTGPSAVIDPPPNAPEVSEEVPSVVAPISTVEGNTTSAMPNVPKVILTEDAAGSEAPAQIHHDERPAASSDQSARQAEVGVNQA